MERYVLDTDNETMEDIFGVSTSSRSIFDPTYNAVSGHLLPAIYNGKPSLKIESMLWGIAQNGASISSISINDLLGNNEFLALLKANPCVIPVSGFYKWKLMVDDPLPFYVRIHTREVLAIAGFYLKNKKGRNSFCVVSTDASVLLKPLENSMPCILAPHKVEQWLTGGATELIKEGFKDTSLLPDMTVVRVPDLVNDLSNNHKSLIQPIPKLRDEE